MSSFARIAVNVPGLTGEFDYHLTDELAGQIGAGCLVTVPFGESTVAGEDPASIGNSGPSRAGPPTAARSATSGRSPARRGARGRALLLVLALVA